VNQPVDKAASEQQTPHEAPCVSEEQFIWEEGRDY